ncbi:MAG TPA: ParA family protein [Thermoanaerobaculia bacterium]|nr:ParA family protein [Thermoanaerobaculia bacterium]
MKTVVFFNPKGGVGRTTLVYHLAWMFQELGVDTLAVDLDAQATLTETFLPVEMLEDIWLREQSPRTIFGALQPLLDGIGMEAPVPMEMAEHLALLPGHLGLSRLEDRFVGPDAHDAATAVQRVIELAARTCGANLVLLDVGPGLTALNRASCTLSDFMVMPLGADVYSLHGLRVLGQAIDVFRTGGVGPIGYIVLQRIRAGRPIKAAHYWIDRISAAYHHEILGAPENAILPDPDPHKLGTLKPYRSLMLLAQDVRKPMFLLKPADGAIGAFSEAVLDCYRDFKALATGIAAACGIAIPSSSASL